MADIDKLLKDGLIGASIAVATDTVLHAGVPIETAALIGGATAEVLGISNRSSSKSRSEPSRSPNYQRSRRERDFDRDLARIQSNPNSSYAGGSGMNRVHVFHHDGDKENEPHPPFSQGDGREDFAFTERSNYAENLEYEPFEPDSPPETPKKKVPVEVQESIRKYEGRSPSKSCEKHGIDMPANSCYSCGSGGKMCEHLAKFDGTQKKAHCVYPETRQEVALASKSKGKPLKEHRTSNRTHLTGIERNNLLALADGTMVEDKESLRQELGDHIDSSLSHGENKTLMQDYLSSVMPTNDYTEAEIRETEARINQLDPTQFERANNPFLIDNLKMRAEQGDVSAKTELELMDINRQQFSQISDPAMSWCSSTPETLEYSQRFVPPPEAVNPQLKPLI